MKILQIAQSAVGGGASRVALLLHRGYRAAGHDARLLVKFAENGLPGVVAADAFARTSIWAPLCAITDGLLGRLPPFRGQRRLREGFLDLAWPRRWRERRQGLEDFNYPYSHRLLDDPRWVPDIIHLHNVNANFFDLRALPALSRRVPLVVTLHDCWWFTGHCAHPLDCPKWRTGCGDCPDLVRVPAVRRDQTAANWRRKRDLYARSRLFVAGNGAWVCNLARESMLTARDLRVIYNGIDLSTFNPGNQSVSRKILGLPQGDFICLAVLKSGGRKDPYKDVTAIKNAIEMVESGGKAAPFLSVLVGGRGEANLTPKGKAVGYIKDSRTLAHYYRAADVFLHAARGESFGMTLVEAQACGTPVIATAVGGIPETMQEGVTGFLVPPGDSAGMARAIAGLAEDRKRAKAMGEAAALWARERFSVARQVQDYLEWYQEIRVMEGNPESPACRQNQETPGLIGKLRV